MLGGMLNCRELSATWSSMVTVRALSAGVKYPKAIGFRRISINDLDWRPSPLPNADAWRAGEPDLPAGAFDCHAWPGFGSARPVRAVRTQHIGEDGDRVVALEGDEGGRLGQPLAEGRLDSCTEWAEALGQVAQERDRGTVVDYARIAGCGNGLGTGETA
jgi:hypothetical protein